MDDLRDLRKMIDSAREIDERNKPNNPRITQTFDNGVLIQLDDDNTKNAFYAYPPEEALALDLSDIPLSEDLWEFHEWILTTCADALTTSSVEEVYWAMQAIKDEYYRREQTPQYRDDLFSNLFEYYGRWIRVLGDKMIRLTMYYIGQRTMPIEIVLPQPSTSEPNRVERIGNQLEAQEIVDRWGKFREQITFARDIDDRNKKIRSNDTEYLHWQPLVPSNPPHERLQVDFSGESLCDDAIAYHSWILNTYPEVLETTSSEDVAWVLEDIGRERQRRYEVVGIHVGHTCLWGTYHKWHHVLLTKQAMIQQYFGDIRAAKIHLIPPGGTAPAEVKPPEPPQEKPQQQPQSTQGGVEEFLRTVDEEE
jgi:hypothetical protein